MQKEQRRRRTEARPRPERRSDSIHFNRKLMVSIFLLILILLIKYLPLPGLSDLVSSTVKTDTNYFQMIAEIKEVIKKHTIGHKLFHSPLTGEITSPFGERINPFTQETEQHTGIDYNASENTPVLAAFQGEVIRTEENESYGKFIVIQHQNNLQTVYGHLNEFLKEVGDVVATKDQIALSGNTGKSTGPHLHFEIRLDKVPVDPAPYLVQ